MSIQTTWPTVRLADIGQSLIGLTYSPDNVRRSGTLVLRSSNIQDGRLVFDDTVYVDSPIPEKIRVRENDILICVRNGSRRLIGKSVMLDRRVTGQTFGAFMAVFRSRANPFLQYFFQSDDFKRQIDEHLGATINQITNGSLNSFVVSLPSRAEQKVITSILRDADTLIVTLETLIAKKRAVKEGMMQQLLAGRTRLPGFVTPWRVARFEDLASPARERVDPRSAGDLTRLIELEHIESVSGRLVQQATANSAVSLKTVFRRGDVLFGKLRAYLRKYWLADSNGICSTEIWALRAKPGTVSGYLRYLVETERFIEVASGGYGTHMPRSDWRMLRGLEFAMPSLEEQNAIALVLAEADDEIEALRARLGKASAIKQGMMQELLTGRTRLPLEATS